MIKYEKATIDDAYGIEYVGSHSWRETYSYILPEDYLDSRISDIENRTEKTKNFLNSYKGNYIVAKDDDRVIGILAYDKDNTDNNYGYISALYLLQEYQGQGIGKELFKIAVNGLKEMGFSKMRLECLTGNKTLDFYKKYLGEVVGEGTHPINGKDYKVDIVAFNDLDATLELLKEKRK